jgi:hypothetical protein
MSDAADVGNDFDADLKGVETVVEELERKAQAEAVSQAEKNAALYAALDRAFKFHRAWSAKPQYSNLLKAKGVNPAPRGKKSSQFTPTIKAFFDPSLDSFAPTADDQDGKKEKARRQKTVSFYGSALDYAEWSKDGADDVAKFIAEQGGIEAVRAKWAIVRSAADDVIEKKKVAKQTRAEKIASGLTELQKSMLATIPANSDLKGKACLAAIYFDDAGVAHFLGLPTQDKSATALLEKYLLANSPVEEKEAKKRGRKAGTTTPKAKQQTDLDKLLRLLSVGKIANPVDANVIVINSDKNCVIRSADSSYDTCIVNVSLPSQDFLPHGTYWIGAKAIAGMKKLAALGKNGAQFAIMGPSAIEGRDATFNLAVSNSQVAIDAFNAKSKDVQWDWRSVIPNEDIRRVSEADGSATISYVSTTDKMAQAKLINNWDANITVEGNFAGWLATTLGIDKKDTNTRLVKAIGGGSKKTTSFRITANDWTVMDRKGDVETHKFKAAIGGKNFKAEITVGSGEILAAWNTVKALADGGPVTISIKDKLLRIHAENGNSSATVFIPSIGDGGRYEAYTEFLAPLK